jgi:hypothetical protein
MERLRRLMDRWASEANVLERALASRERLLLRGQEASVPDAVVVECRRLAFHLAQRIGQCLDAELSLAALDGDQASGNSARLRRLWQRGGRSDQRALGAWTEVLAQAVWMRTRNAENFDDAFSAACDFRQLLTVTRALPRREGVDLVNLADKIIEDVEDMAGPDQADFRDSVRALISESWLYRGIHDLNDINAGVGYSGLFRMASVATRGGNMRGTAGLDHALEELELDPRVREAISRLFERVKDIAEQDGPGILDVGTWRGQYVTGGDPDVMVIPGDGTGACKKVLLAVADSHARGDRSPKNVIKRLQEVLVQCAPGVQVAIFISDAPGMGAVLEDNLGLIEAHIRRGNLKGFLPVIVVGGRLTVIGWRN